MNFAAIATSAAAVIALPLAVSAAGPQMSNREFLSSVRCVAYETITASAADLGTERWRLNAEAAKQPAATVAQAAHEVNLIARVAEQAPESAASLRASACAQARATA